MSGEIYNILHKKCIFYLNIFVTLTMYLIKRRDAHAIRIVEGNRSLQTTKYMKNVWINLSQNNGEMLESYHLKYKR